MWNMDYLFKMPGKYILNNNVLIRYYLYLLSIDWFCLNLIRNNYY